jgi:transcriptional regulator with XRE-family HTH domain
MVERNTSTDTVGSRIRRYRKEKNISLSRLARDAGISKGYLWNLENPPEGDHHQRPSGETLYVIAKALGVTMSDLLGRKLMIERDATADPALEKFAEEDGLSQADVEMLASIQWRGDKPTSVDRWRYIYRSIVMSRSLDTESTEGDR